MTPSHERLMAHLTRLKLVHVRDILDPLLEDAAKRELSYANFLDGVLRAEVQSKQDKRIRMGRLIAHFPFQRALEQFDCAAQPSIDPKMGREISTCRFIDNAENVMLLGPPGVDKTHLAVAIRLRAIEAGYSTLFVTAAGLIAQLEKAGRENRLDEELKRQQGLRAVAPGARRRHARGRNPQPRAPPQQHPEHQRRKLPTAREAQGGADQEHRIADAVNRAQHGS